MLKSCGKCGKVHDINYNCSKRIYIRTDKDRFRQSSKWTNKAIEIKERDKYLCQVCLEKGILNYKDLEVHHIEKLNDRYDLRLDNDNLITLCNSCHRKADKGELGKEYLKALVSPV